MVHILLVWRLVYDVLCLLRINLNYAVAAGVVRAWDWLLTSSEQLLQINSTYNKVYWELKKLLVPFYMSQTIRGLCEESLRETYIVMYQIQ